MAPPIGQAHTDHLHVYFVKFFSEEAHAQRFLDGEMLFRPLSYFRELEEHDGRGDSAEGLFAWLQPKGLEMRLSVPPIGETLITEVDLAGPVSISLADDAPHFIFSMHNVGLSGIRLLNDTEFDSALDQRELEAQLQIDARCLEFGRHAVIVPVKPFIERLKFAGRFLGWKARTGLVQYYDEGTFNGQFTMAEAPFRKQRRFSYQREFRICITQPPAAGPMRFEQLGSIRSFAQCVPAEALIGTFKLSLLAI